MKEKQDPRMKQLAELLRREAGATIEVGKLIVAMVHDDPLNHDRIKAAFNLPEKEMKRYRDYALGLINPVLANSKAPARNFLETLDRKVQDKAIKDGVMVVIRLDGDKIESKRIPYDKISNPHARLALSKDGERSLDEQAARLRQSSIKVFQLSIERRGDRVSIRNVTCTLKELRSKLEQMESEYALELSSQSKAA
jgi:hypothetical protein